MKILLLFLLAGFIPLAFGDSMITPTIGSGAPGCEDTVNGCYTPTILFVDMGESIVLKNTDTAAHTFTSGDPDNGPSGEFDTGLLMAGNSFEFTPESSGQIDYFCMVHPWMIGIIIIGSGITPIEPIPVPMPVENDNDLIAENEILRAENLDLKLENRELKIKINDKQNEIDSLKDQIVSMSGEFVEMVNQLNEWFRSQLG